MLSLFLLGEYFLICKIIWIVKTELLISELLRTNYKFQEFHTSEGLYIGQTLIFQHEMLFY